MARDVIDLTGSEPQLASAVVNADRGLRFGLGVCFAAAAVLAPAPLGRATSAGFAAVALLHLADRLPRLATAAGAGLALFALLARAAPAPWLGVLAAALVRAGLQWGPAGAQLARVRALRRAQMRGVAAMELRRARAGRLPEERKAEELQRAGDAFERAGRARAELRALGLAGRTAARPRWAAPAADALPAHLGETALRWLEAGPREPGGDDASG